ncbi:hypothetical protein [Corallococcus macrosporus]|uniref:hypothetical protein n=1 Tax=Corallococcus macrosporus TaxID=35 RepID=UPI0012FD916D|nr:hypothetical protein [Corallococcus macrosporus]
MPIICGDTQSRTLAMDASGFAGFLKVPINEPVRGTPWNHQRACAATAGDSIRKADANLTKARKQVK